MRKILLFMLVLLCFSAVSAKTNYYWTRMPGNFGGKISCMVSDKQGNLYAGSIALFSSSDEGESWTKISDKISPGRIKNLIISDSLILADFEQGDCDVISSYTKLTKDKGKTWYWDSTYDEYKDNPFRNKLLSFGGIYYIETNNQILKSVDGGKSWISIDTSNGSFSNLVLDKNGCLLYYENENNIWKYNPNTNEITKLVFDSTTNQYGLTGICIDSSNNYYIGLSNSNNNYLNISRDEGKTWNRTGFHYDIEDMIAIKGDTVFISSYDNGIFYTPDQGNNWITSLSTKYYWNRFYLSPAGNLFIYGNSILKFNQGSWTLKAEGIDVDNITSISEQNNNLYSGSMTTGINYFNKSDNKWENYLDYSDYFHIDNFIISGNNFIAVDYDNVSISDINLKKWIPYPQMTSGFGFYCDPIWSPLLQTKDSLVCYSFQESQYTYISHDYGETWKNISSIFDSSTIYSNFIDKNGYIYIVKTDNSGAADSIKGPVILSKDGGKTWDKTNSNFAVSYYYSYLIRDIHNNVILINDNIFYKFNISTNSWDTLYITAQQYNPNVLFINDHQYIAIVQKDYGPSTSQAIVVDMLAGTIDTILDDYNMLQINRFFRASDGSVYAATDRGVFKLEINNDVASNEDNNNKFIIYPNPANETLNISYKNDMYGLVSISIINPLGEVVFEKNVDNRYTFNSIQINTKDYTTGFYFCILKTQGETIVQKFVIIR